MREYGLQNVKVGDEIAISRGGWQGGYLVSRVERLTETQVITEGGEHWRKRDGWHVGSRVLGYSVAYDMTHTIRAEIAEFARVKVVTGVLSNIHGTLSALGSRREYIDLDKLKRIHALMLECTQQEEAHDA